MPLKWVDARVVGVGDVADEALVSSRSPPPAGRRGLAGPAAADGPFHSISIGTTTMSLDRAPTATRSSTRSCSPPPGCCSGGDLTGIRLRAAIDGPRRFRPQNEPDTQVRCIGTLSDSDARPDLHLRTNYRPTGPTRPTDLPWRCPRRWARKARARLPATRNSARVSEPTDRFVRIDGTRGSNPLSSTNFRRSVACRAPREAAPRSFVTQMSPGSPTRE
jgi:hypothetical protein